jgi:hypothetical protein
MAQKSPAAQSMSEEAIRQDGADSKYEDQLVELSGVNGQIKPDESKRARGTTRAAVRRVLRVHDARIPPEKASFAERELLDESVLKSR